MQMPSADASALISFFLYRNGWGKTAIPGMLRNLHSVSQNEAMHAEMIHPHSYRAKVVIITNEESEDNM